jgi:hypothetical protein
MTKRIKAIIIEMDSESFFIYDDLRIKIWIGCVQGESPDRRRPERQKEKKRNIYILFLKTFPSPAG